MVGKLGWMWEFALRGSRLKVEELRGLKEAEEPKSAKSSKKRMRTRERPRRELPDEPQTWCASSAGCGALS